MHAALGGVDVVCKRDYYLVIAVVILKRYLGLGVGTLALHVDNIVVQGGLVLVNEAYEFTDAALVAHLVLLFLALTLILGGDIQAAV